MLRDLLPLLALAVLCLVALLIAHLLGVRQQRRKPPTTAYGRSMREEPLSPEEEQEMHAIVEHLLRPAVRLRSTVLQPDAALPRPGPTDTIVGAVRVMGRGEQWPTDAKGNPLVGLMQVNLVGMPNVPAQLKGVAFVSVFWDVEALGGLIRDYASHDELVEVAPPSPEANINDGFAVRLVEIEEYPSNANFHDDVPNWGDRSRRWQDRMIHLAHEALHTANPEGDDRWKCKVGGWPAPVQDDILRPLALQVGYDDVARINLVDSGCLYFWREQRDGEWVWDTHLEFY